MALGDVILKSGSSVTTQTINDLGGISFAASANIVLSDEFEIEKLAESADLEAVLTATSGGVNDIWIEDYTKDANIPTTITSGGDLRALGYRDHVDKEVTLTPAATVDIDWDSGNIFFITMNQNTTFTFSNTPSSGEESKEIILILKQDATGSRVPTFPSTVTWGRSGGPIWTTAASKFDLVILRHLGSHTNTIGVWVDGDLTVS
jgi:hypothetical protein